MTRMKKIGIVGAVLGVSAIATCVTLSLSGVNPLGNLLANQSVVSNKVVDKTELKLVSDEGKTKKGITIHFQWNSEDGEFPHLYYENVEGTSKTIMNQPGVPMHDDGDGWYSYTIAGAKTASVMVSVPEKGYATTLQKKTAEEYWLSNGKWCLSDPTVDKEKKVEKDAVQNTATNDSIKVHCYYADGQPTLYYWNALPEDQETDWPGVKMSSDGDGWYSYTFDKTSKINVLFNCGDTQSEDFKATAGEWWYDGSKFDNKGPSATSDPNVTPNPDATPRPTVVPGNSNDFREESIYFLMTTRFFDGDSSNNVHCEHDAEVGNGDSDPAWRGDFKGLIEKLDYIKALGFSAIWITPVVENASGYDYHGYHALNFKKVDPRLETDGADYQTLINECHKRGMKLIQDVVFNHTSQWGEDGLHKLFEQKYVLNKGASGNSVTKVRADNGELDRTMTSASVETGCGQSSDYDNVTGEKAPYAQFIARILALKDDKIYRSRDTCTRINYETYEATTGQIADDCQEINTENPFVYNYLTDAYSDYIKMGVDAFRVDTVKHVSRLTFNKAIIPKLKAAAKAATGNEDFYMFGEVCTRAPEIFNRGNARVSAFYYTWKEEKEYAWNDSSQDGKDNLVQCAKAYDESRAYQENFKDGEYGVSDNAFLKGNEYHTPDYTYSSGMGVIDYTMHINFTTAGQAYQAGLDEDKYFNDSTYNVVYVDSHDYGPNVEGRDDQGHDKWRYEGGTTAWAENLDLMFTFRGIPCLYYGSEIEFKKGCKIDDYNSPLESSGRAYFGDHIEGSVNTTDFGVYNGATGAMQETLNAPLAKHLQKLNRMRRAVPALQKGQYSTEDCNGGMCFKRRYTDSKTGVDSYALVAISKGATFSNVLNGTYVDIVTGDKKTVSNGTLTTGDLSQANMRIYVLQNDTAEDYGATGQIGEKTTYLK